MESDIDWNLAKRLLTTEDTEYTEKRKNHMNPNELISSKETYALRGAAFEVYKEKGCGFVEPVYQDCLELEFGFQNIPHARHPILDLSYKGKPLPSKFVPDFICYGNIIVELKSVTALNDEHRAQVHNYLKATGHKLALLINFGHHPKVEIERIVR